MKRTIFLSAAIICGLVSCSKEYTTITNQNANAIVYTATIVDAEETKTSIDRVSGKVSWNDGDEITVTDGTSSAVYVAKVSENDSSIAEFSLKSGESAPKGEIKGATYGDVNNQHYDPLHVGSNCPMRSGAPEGTQLKFTNTCGVLSIQAKSSGINLKKIIVDNYTLNIDSKNISSESVFDIALPEGEYSSLTIKFISAENKLCEKVYKSGNFSIGKNKLKRLTFSSDLVFNTYEPLQGEFTINNKGDKVKFAPGNVWKDSEGNTLFEANQYDFHSVPEQHAVVNGVETTTADGEVGLFSHAEATAMSFNSYRLLTYAEWTYIINGNSYRKNIDRYAMVIVNGYPGILLFPDIFSWPEGVTKPNPQYINAFINGDSWSDNATSYDIANFAKLENAGAVFIAALGDVDHQGTFKFYSATYRRQGGMDISYGRYITSDGATNPLFFNPYQLNNSWVNAASKVCVRFVTPIN